MAAVDDEGATSHGASGVTKMLYNLRGGLVVPIPPHFCSVPKDMFPEVPICSSHAGVSLIHAHVDPQLPT